MAIRMRPVESSSIESVGYEADSRELQVRFRESGETYVYYGVEPETYESFLAAESMGVYLNRQIKKRYFYKKLD